MRLSKCKAERAAEVDSELDAQEGVKPVVSSEWNAMRAALDKRLGVLEDRVVPVKDYDYVEQMWRLASTGRRPVRRWLARMRRTRMRSYRVGSSGPLHNPAERQQGRRAGQR